MRYIIPLCVAILLNIAMAWFAFTVMDWMDVWESEEHLLTHGEVLCAYAALTWHAYSYLFVLITMGGAVLFGALWPMLKPAIVFLAQALGPFCIAIALNVALTWFAWAAARWELAARATGRELTAAESLCASFADAWVSYWYLCALITISVAIAVGVRLVRGKRNVRMKDEG